MGNENVTMLTAETAQKAMQIENFKEFLCNIEGALIGDSPEYLEVCPLKHSFVDGAYVREIFLPAGMFFVTKIHKKTHPYFILKGTVSVLIDDKTKVIEAPFSGITQAGTQRIIYTHKDTVWITVHVTNETDLGKIEKEIITEYTHVIQHEKELI